jgi:hypothetical protein
MRDFDGLGLGLEPELVDVGGLCRMLDISRRTLFAKRAAGLIPEPEIKWSRKCIKWRLATIRAWLAHGAPPVEQWQRLLTERRQPATPGRS